jgi:hypothetical protein
MKNLQALFGNAWDPSYKSSGHYCLSNGRSEGYDDQEDGRGVSGDYVNQDQLVAGQVGAAPTCPFLQE